MIKAVIFDFDNTLMDFMKMKRTAVEAAVDAMIDAGLKIPKEEMIKKIYRIYWKEGIEDQQVFDKVLLKDLGEIDYKILAAGIVGYRRAKEGSMTLYPHTRFTLTTLIRKGIELAIISDAPRLPVWTRICSLGLQDYFDCIITSEDTGETKPSAKPFLVVLEKLKVKAEESIMVGDWAERDILGAKQLGIRTVFARYGDQFGTKNSAADYEIEDIIELVDIITQINNG